MLILLAPIKPVIGFKVAAATIKSASAAMRAYAIAAQGLIKGMSIRHLMEDEELDDFFNLAGGLSPTPAAPAAKTAAPAASTAAPR